MLSDSERRHGNPSTTGVSGCGQKSPVSGGTEAILPRALMPAPPHRRSGAFHAYSPGALPKPRRHALATHARAPPALQRDPLPHRERHHEHDKALLEGANSVSTVTAGAVWSQTGSGNGVVEAPLEAMMSSRDLMPSMRYVMSPSSGVEQRAQ